MKGGAAAPPTSWPPASAVYLAMTVVLFGMGIVGLLRARREAESPAVVAAAR